MVAGKVLGWIAVVCGVIAGLVPINGHGLFGVDVACGPAVVAIFNKGDGAGMCRNPAASWVLIGAVLIVAGIAALVAASRPTADDLRARAHRPPNPRMPFVVVGGLLLVSAIVIVAARTYVVG